jgi:hypothetical protein
LQRAKLIGYVKSNAGPRERGGADHVDDAARGQRVRGDRHIVHGAIRRDLDGHRELAGEVAPHSRSRFVNGLIVACTAAGSNGTPAGTSSWRSSSSSVGAARRRLAGAGRSTTTGGGRRCHLERAARRHLQAASAASSPARMAGSIARPGSNSRADCSGGFCCKQSWCRGAWVS